MKVNQTGSSPVQSSDVSSTKKSEKTSKSESSGRATSSSNSSEAAKTDISAKAKEFAKAKDVAAKSPEVREEKIAKIREKIAAGQYKVDTDAVADRMVAEHLEMN